MSKIDEFISLTKGRKPAAEGAKSPDGKRIKRGGKWVPVKSTKTKRSTRRQQGQQANQKSTTVLRERLVSSQDTVRRLKQSVVKLKKQVTVLKDSVSLTGKWADHNRNLVSLWENKLKTEESLLQQHIKRRDSVKEQIRGLK